MPSEYCLMHVGHWVTDLAAISCLGAGLAAIVLTLLPGKKLTGKSEGLDPSSFIDPGAGETARYRLAYKDLVSTKNSTLEATQVAPLRLSANPTTLESTKDLTTVQSASDLALTMFDQGVLGMSLGERSQEATKQMSNTKVDSKTKLDSKTKIESKPKTSKAKDDAKTMIEPKAKVDSKTKVESKAKPEPKAKEPKAKEQKNDPKKDQKKEMGGANMAVRKVTFGAKANQAPSEAAAPSTPPEEVPSVESPLSGQFPQQAQFPPSGHFPQQAQTPPSGQFPQQRQFPPSGQFPQQPGFVQQLPPQPPAGNFMQQGQIPPSGQFPQQAPSGQFAQQGQFLPQQENPEDQNALNLKQEPKKDPNKDPNKVGRATLIEPRSNLTGNQGTSEQKPPSSDNEPPPLEYFK